MRQVPLVTSIQLHYTQIMVNFCSPAERPHCRVILPVRHLQAVRNNITLKVTVCITTSKGKIASVTFHSVVSCRHLSHGRSQHVSRRLQQRSRFYRNFPNSQKPWANWACANSVFQALFFFTHIQDRGEWRSGSHLTSGLILYFLFLHHADGPPACGS